MSVSQMKARLQSCLPAAQVDSFNILLVPFGLWLPISVEQKPPQICL